MTWGRQPSSRSLRQELVDHLTATGSLTDPAVRDAFLAVPRERFLPAIAAARGLAAVYADDAIVVRTDDRGAPTSSSSQPAIMAVMLEQLELRPGHRVLEIGTGTGYNAALLAVVVGGSGRVTSVELEPDLAGAARAALAEAGADLPGAASVEVVQGDGHLGWTAGAPYDAIVVTASTPAVPEAWFRQLVPGGRLVVPLHLATADLQAVVTLRADADRLRSTAVVGGGFMVLRHPTVAGSVGDDASATASVSVSEQLGGRHRSLGALVGDGLAGLRPGARERLAQRMLERPIRRRQLGPLVGGRSPGLFLRLSRPEGVVMLTYSSSSRPRRMYQPVAAATADGESLAVLSITEATHVELASYGDDRAAEVVVALLDEWRARGRPNQDDLVVEVTFPGDGRAVTSTSWDPRS